MKTTLKTSWILLWMHTMFQPIIYNNGGLYCRLYYLYWMEKMCLWESSNKVRSNSCPSPYMDSFASRIFILYLLNLNSPLSQNDCICHYPFWDFILFKHIFHQSHVGGRCKNNIFKCKVLRYFNARCCILWGAL